MREPGFDGRVYETKMAYYFSGVRLLQRKLCVERVEGNRKTIPVVCFELRADDLPLSTSPRASSAPLRSVAMPAEGAAVRVGRSSCVGCTVAGRSIFLTFLLADCWRALLITITAAVHIAEANSKWRHLLSVAVNGEEAPHVPYKV